MLIAVARRLVSMLVTLLGVSVVIFVVLRLLPGDAVSASLGVSEGLLSPAQHAELDRLLRHRPAGGGAVPLVAPRDAERATSASRWRRARPSSSLIGQALPVTLEVGLAALVLGVLLGVGLGMLGALHPGKLPDDVGQGVAVVGLGVPSFVIGTALVTFLSSHFHYFPSSQGLRGRSRATRG